MGIEKRYGGVRALKHVSFDLQAGEVHALIGENGAGKSTLIKVLTGAVDPDGGSVELNGVCIERNSPSVSRALGIVAIYQQPQIFPDLSVSENIALFNEAGGMANRIRWADRCGNAKRLLAEIGSDIDPAREAGTLSMPEQQIVEIAKALGANLKVLILDEPTASLTDRETDRLFDVMLVEIGFEARQREARNEFFRQIADQGFPNDDKTVFADTADEVTVYREYPFVPLAVLPQFGPAWEAAYATAADSTPHARLDVTQWIGVDTE